MDRRAWETLEFHKVIEQLKEHAASSLGKHMVASLEPSHDMEDVRQRQAATFEGTEVLRLKGQVPLGGIGDIRPHIQRAKIGGVLNASELLAIANTLASAGRLKRFILNVVEEEELELPILQRLADDLVPLRPLQQSIKSCIDEYGQVLDSATSLLRKLRNEIRRLESRARQALEQMTRSSANQKMLQETLVTIRNERYVIPVKADYRQAFGGIVHDQSASGATLFVEPQTVVNINNQLNEARVKEEKEIERILTDLSVEVQEHVLELTDNASRLAELDFLFAKAFYAQRIEGTQPVLNDVSRMRIKKGRHPLIPAEEVVPLDIELGDNQTSLIITGPNTGGKTVSLKTAGLLTLMAQAGLFVPAEDESEFAVFSSVYADIGDEQSIEQNLSTFSGHMKNMIRILDHFDRQSLILLDEIGAGTDPAEGAALAIAILDHISNRGARVIATTHYSEMKAYAYNREEALNASVEFDVESLQPTYRLLMGVPGKSNAFAVAGRLGLQTPVIEAARQQMGQDESKVQHMIQSLEEQRSAAEKSKMTAEELKREAERLWADVESQRRQLEEEKQQIREKAKQQAQEEVNRAKQEAEAIVSELREMAKEEQAGIKEHRLIEAKKGLDDAVPEWETSSTASKRIGAANQTIRPGDDVRVLSVGQKGHVIEETGKQEFEVQIGIMKMKVRHSDLEKIGSGSKEPEVAVAPVKSNRETVKTELDLRGFNVDDAVMDIDRYIDEAVLAGLNQVSVIHGKGTGVLRKGVHDYLRRHRNVRSYRLGGQGEGGSGSTIVELR